MLALRLATPEDAPAMGRVHVQVCRETYPGIVPQKILDAMDANARAERWRTILETPPPKSAFWLAVDETGLLGFCGCGPARDLALGQPGEIFMINILKAGQSRGTGRALMRHAAQSLRDAGFDSAGLWVFVENYNARGFYKRLGGVETNIRQNVDFNGDPRPEMAVHWKDICILASYPSTGT